jgi:hypothetical protein
MGLCRTLVMLKSELMEAYRLEETRQPLPQFRGDR